MPRDTNGNYTLPTGTLAVPGQTIEVGQHNPAMTDIQAALSGSLSRDGAGTMRADLDMGGFDIKNIKGGLGTPIGTFVEARNKVGGIAIPATTNRVTTSGYSKPGLGSADYVFDASMVVPTERGPNLIVNSNDLTQAPWAPVPGGTAALVSYDGTWSTLTDDSTTGYARIQQYANFTNARYATLDVEVQKDSIPATQRQPTIRLVFANASSDLKRCDVRLDTMEGVITPGDRSGSGASPAFDIRIADLGDRWRVVVSGTSPDGTTRVAARLYPADGINNTGTETAVGSARFRNVRLYSGVSDLYVAPDPVRSTFKAADGRVFMLALDQTITHYQFGCADDSAVLDDEAWGAFNTFISQNRCPNVSVGGRVHVAQGLSLGPSNSIIASDALSGFLRVNVAGVSDIGVLMQNVYALDWPDGLQIITGGGQDIESRTCKAGVSLKGNCGRARIGRIRADGMRYATLRAATGSRDNFNFFTVGHLMGNTAGSGSGNAGNLGSVTSTWQWVRDEGTAGSILQRSVLSVATNVPDWMTVLFGQLSDNPVQVRINNRTYSVRVVNATEQTISIFPWLPAALRQVEAQGTLRYIWGGTLVATGGNSRIIVDMIDSSLSGRTAVLGSLHGCVIGGHNTTSNGQGFLLGRNFDGISLGNVIESSYFEDKTNPEEFHALSPNVYLEVYAGHQTEYARWADGTGPRASDDSFVTQSGAETGYRNVSIVRSGKRFSYQRRPAGFPRPTSITITCGSGDYVDNGDTLTVNLSAADAGLSRSMGYTGCVIRRWGPNGGNPAGALTVNAPAGGTVNGSANVVIPASATVELRTFDPDNLIWFAR